VGRGTVTLVAAPLGSLLPGRPVDWDQLPPDARKWAGQQANNGNEMITVIEGDHRGELQGNYDVYLATVA
jgi:hypothetical protein